MGGISDTADLSRVAETIVRTPFGRDLYLACDDDGITASAFRTRRRVAATTTRARHPVLAAATAELDAYFARRRAAFDVPLVLAGTAFQVAVWRAVARLPAGEVASYAEIAAAIGRPLAHRGVAAALARTPLALFVPAHRVVGVDGRIKGATPGSMRRRLATFERLPVR